jgi:hypothetical protein
MPKRLRLFWLITSLLLLLPGCRFLSRTPVTDGSEVSQSRGSQGQVSDPAVLTSGRFSTRYGTLKVARELIIHVDGVVTDRRVVTATDEFAKNYRQELARPQGWAMNMKDEGHRVVLTLEREYKDLQEYNADRQNQRDGSLLEVNSWLFRKLSFQTTVGGFDRDAMRGAFGGHPQATADDWADFLSRAITYSYRVTFPSKVTKTTEGTILPPGTTIEWESPIGRMQRPVTLLVESKRYRWGAWVAGTLMILVVGGLAAVRFTRKYWDPDE